MEVSGQVHEVDKASLNKPRTTRFSLYVLTSKRKMLQTNVGGSRSSQWFLFAAEA